MRILIIGGTSAVGRSLRATLSKSFQVITAGRRDCDIILDLKDPLSKYNLPNDVDVVIHTAAQFGVHTDEEILETEDINVLGTLKVCLAAVQVKAGHLIYISSIFSTTGINSVNYNFYSLSKKQAEEVATLYCAKHQLPLTILRPSQLYGVDYGFKIHQPFLYAMIEKAAKGEDITLYGGNDPIRNYLNIEDLVEIITRVVVYKVEGIYSCSFTSDITYSQIAKSAFDTFNQGGTVCFLDDKPDIPSFVFEKDYSLYEKINFYPEISMEEGLRRFLIKE